MTEENSETIGAPAPETSEESTSAPVEPETAPETPVETPAEEEAPAADDTAHRDPSVAVGADELLTENARLARINYLAAHPDERTAHDPVSADGERV